MGEVGSHNLMTIFETVFGHVKSGTKEPSVIIRCIDGGLLFDFRVLRHHLLEIVDIGILEETGFESGGFWLVFHQSL